jgi:hypothetical protein
VLDFPEKFQWLWPMGIFSVKLFFQFCMYPASENAIPAHRLPMIHNQRLTPVNSRALYEHKA